jgi:hypothetical protein
LPVATIVRNLLSAAALFIHARRLEALVDACVAITRAGRLSVGPMGRHFPCATTAKHTIKRFDRLLANAHVFNEIPLMYQAVAQQILQPQERVAVLIDWTHVTGIFHALVAAVSFRGRAVVVLSEVRPERKLGNTLVQRQFLKRLHSVLPNGCRPIIISDAGFHGDVFKQALALGWDFIGRIRGTSSMSRGQEALTKEMLYRRASTTAQDLGWYALYKGKKSMPVRIVLIRKRRRRRRSRPSRNKEVIAYRKSCRDPWLLVTSLGLPVSAGAVISLYERRMQIEETFRDAKSHRFGWSMGTIRSGSAARLAVLIALASLTMLTVLLIGFHTENTGTHRHLQANTSKRRVLSLFTIGVSVLARGLRAFPHHLALDALREALRLRPSLSALRFRGDP